MARTVLFALILLTRASVWAGDDVDARAPDLEQGRPFWSFQPIQTPSVPAVRNVDWPATPIDHFVLAQLEERGLKPVGDAEPGRLLRRLSFDLVGLPPTPEETRAFVAAANRDRRRAVVEVVDRLLASPHFGERWGRHWLDVVRYAESNGRDINVVWHHAWRYRAWVIGSLNEDKPFDEFVREQIAGDLLPADSREQRDRQVTATAMLAMTPKTFIDVDAKVFQMDLIDDQIDVVSRAFLGLSVSCARCHDHKFDPIPTRDYYALAGIFRSTEPLYGFARVGARNTQHSELHAVGPDAERLGPAGREYRQQVIDRTLAFSKARSDRYRIVRQVGDLKNQLEKPEADATRIRREIAEKEAEIKEWDARIKRLEKQLNDFKANPPPQPQWTMAARDRSEPADCRVHVRGETTNLGDRVPRGVPRVVSVPDVPAIEPGQSGRLHLAEWLASPHNPLTPRVAVNRVWSHLFGRGIVASVDDLGTTGSPPSHPELLDYLASRFVEDGWSVKRLIRSLVLSRTYQLAATIEPRQQAIDPDNITLWRFRPRRLEVEVYRDAVLAISGVLDPAPPSEPFLSRWNPYEHTDLKSFRPFVTPEQIEFGHRSVYLPVLRDSLPVLFELFDFADPNRVVGRRDECTLPAQSLFLMNSRWTIERSRLAARRLLAEPDLSDAGRIDRFYELALGRLPTEAERKLAVEYVGEPEDLQPDPQAKQAPSAAVRREERWTSFCQLVFAGGEFWYVR